MKFGVHSQHYCIIIQVTTIMLISKAPTFLCLPQCTMATLEAETSVETSSFFVPPTFLKTESSRDKKKKKTQKKHLSLYKAAFTTHH